MFSEFDDGEGDISQHVKLNDAIRRINREQLDHSFIFIHYVAIKNCVIQWLDDIWFTNLYLVCTG